MNLAKLFEMQRELDEHIVKEKGLEGQDLLQEKILALYTELGELANELPEGFKYWSNKKNNYEKALKEYVDCLHFILSIGLHLGVDTNRKYKSERYNSITIQFNRLFREIGTLWDYGRIPRYTWIVDMLIGLGEMLEFSWSEIEEAYMSKNKENHVRQENGY